MNNTCRETQVVAAPKACCCAALCTALLQIAGVKVYGIDLFDNDAATGQETLNQRASLKCAVQQCGSAMSADAPACRIATDCPQPIIHISLANKVHLEAAAVMPGYCPITGLHAFLCCCCAVAAMNTAGLVPICYFSTQYENWRPDNLSFPANALGNAISGWAGEKYVDIRRPEIRNIMAAVRRLHSCRKQQQLAGNRSLQETTARS
jgi:hypothetical protein